MSPASRGDGATGNASDPIQARIDELGPWFHNLHLPSGHQTAPDHPLGDFPTFKWKRIEPHLPDDLSGWRVLDLGTNAGFYAFELAKRGAEVVAIDVDPRYLHQARWAADQFDLADRITFRRAQVYEMVDETDQFDLVLFLGLFYHLRYPLLALDLVTQLVDRILVFQSLLLDEQAEHPAVHDLQLFQLDRLREPGWPKMAFIEDQLEGDPTNWWVPNRQGVRAILRSAGLRVEAETGEDIFICHPADKAPGTKRWSRIELMAATGRSWTDRAQDRFEPMDETIEGRAE